jgi:hypothetical protein
MSIPTFILYCFFGLFLSDRGSATKCINTNNQTNEPYQLQAGQSPVSNQIPNGIQLFTPYTTCLLIPYDYAYNPTADCLSNTSNHVIASFVPLFLSPSMLKVAALLEYFIQTHYESSSTGSCTNFTILSQTLINSIKNFGAILQLHLSLDFFSCYTAEEQTAIEVGLSKYEWSSFNITFYNDITCDIDVKQGYIELSADAQSQTTLKTFVQGLQQSVRQNGNVTIKYPRNTNQLFHTTLLTADYRFPYDCMTAQLKNYLNGKLNQWVLGLPITLEVCCFFTQDAITGEIKTYKAKTCTNPVNDCIIEHQKNNTRT